MTSSPQKPVKTLTEAQKKALEKKAEREKKAAEDKKAKEREQAEEAERAAAEEKIRLEDERLKNLVTENFSEDDVHSNIEVPLEVRRALADEQETEKLRQEAAVYKQRCNYEKQRERNLLLELEISKNNAQKLSSPVNMMQTSSSLSLSGTEKTTINTKVWLSGILKDDDLRLELSENSVETLDNLDLWIEDIFTLPRDLVANGGIVFHTWKNKLANLDKKFDCMIKKYSDKKEVGAWVKDSLTVVKRFIEKCKSDLSFDVEKAGILQYVASWGTGNSLGARVMGTEKGNEIEKTLLISKRTFGQKFLHDKSALGLRNVRNSAESKGSGSDFYKKKRSYDEGRNGNNDRGGYRGNSRGRGRGNNRGARGGFGGYNGGYNGYNNQSRGGQGGGNDENTLAMKKMR